MSKLRHYDYLETARFVTIAFFRNYRYFSEQSSRGIFIQELHAARRNHGLRLFGYVIMPEHVHLVVLPPKSLLLRPLIGQLKGRTARWICNLYRENNRKHLCRADGCPAVWERRCYDYNCRTVEDVREKIVYCHRNPVRRGLVNSPDEWLWSSYNWYRGSGKVLVDMDPFDP